MLRLPQHLAPPLCFYAAVSQSAPIWHILENSEDHAGHSVPRWRIELGKTIDSPTAHGVCLVCLLLEVMCVMGEILLSTDAALAEVATSQINALHTFAFSMVVIFAIQLVLMLVAYQGYFFRKLAYMLGWFSMPIATLAKY